MEQMNYLHMETGVERPLYMLEKAEHDWGVTYLLANELDAYRVAYAYRYSRHGVKIDYIANPGWNWQVTIFNAEGQRQGKEGSRPIALPPENLKSLGIPESGGWVGDDFKDCLRAVYENRG